MAVYAIGRDILPSPATFTLKQLAFNFEQDNDTTQDNYKHRRDNSRGKKYIKLLAAPFLNPFHYKKPKSGPNSLVLASVISFKL